MPVNGDDISELFIFHFCLVAQYPNNNLKYIRGLLFSLVLSKASINREVQKVRYYPRFPSEHSANCLQTWFRNEIWKTIGRTWDKNRYIYHFIQTM